ncbi:unnamed protein product [Amoebophrya sp. A120]|nr:unnamed protein product [Amoebophrya sp. A120]|eukprot:GSA120T00008281001.1
MEFQNLLSDASAFKRRQSELTKPILAPKGAAPFLEARQERPRRRTTAEFLGQEKNQFLEWNDHAIVPTSQAPHNITPRHPGQTGVCFSPRKARIKNPNHGSSAATSSSSSSSAAATTRMNKNNYVLGEPADLGPAMTRRNHAAAPTGGPPPGGPIERGRMKNPMQRLLRMKIDEMARDEGEATSRGAAENLLSQEHRDQQHDLHNTVQQPPPTSSTVSSPCALNSKPATSKRVSRHVKLEKTSSTRLPCSPATHTTQKRRSGNAHHAEEKRGASLHDRRELQGGDLDEGPLLYRTERIEGAYVSSSPARTRDVSASRSPGVDRTRTTTTSSKAGVDLDDQVPPTKSHEVVELEHEKSLAGATHAAEAAKQDWQLAREELERVQAETKARTARMQYLEEYTYFATEGGVNESAGATSTLCSSYSGILEGHSGSSPAHYDHDQKRAPLAKGSTAATPTARRVASTTTSSPGGRLVFSPNRSRGRGQLNTGIKASGNKYKITSSTAGLLQEEKKRQMQKLEDEIADLIDALNEERSRTKKSEGTTQIADADKVLSPKTAGWKNDKEVKPADTTSCKTPVRNAQLQDQRKINPSNIASSCDDPCRTAGSTSMRGEEHQHAASTSSLPIMTTGMLVEENYSETAACRLGDHDERDRSFTAEQKVDDTTRSSSGGHFEQPHRADHRGARSPRRGPRSPHKTEDLDHVYVGSGSSHSHLHPRPAAGADLVPAEEVSREDDNNYPTPAAVAPPTTVKITNTNSELLALDQLLTELHVEYERVTVPLEFLKHKKAALESLEKHVQACFAHMEKRAPKVLEKRTAARDLRRILVQMFSASMQGSVAEWDSLAEQLQNILLLGQLYANEQVENAGRKQEVFMSTSSLVADEDQLKHRKILEQAELAHFFAEAILQDQQQNSVQLEEEKEKLSACCQEDKQYLQDLELSTLRNACAVLLRLKRRKRRDKVKQLELKEKFDVEAGKIIAKEKQFDWNTRLMESEFRTKEQELELEWSNNYIATPGGGSGTFTSRTGPRGAAAHAGGPGPPGVTSSKKFPSTNDPPGFSLLLLSKNAPAAPPQHATSNLPALLTNQNHRKTHSFLVDRINRLQKQLDNEEADIAKLQQMGQQVAASKNPEDEEQIAAFVTDAIQLQMTEHFAVLEHLRKQDCLELKNSSNQKETEKVLATGIPYHRQLGEQKQATAVQTEGNVGFVACQNVYDSSTASGFLATGGSLTTSDHHYNVSGYHAGGATKISGGSTTWGSSTIGVDGLLRAGNNKGNNNYAPAGKTKIKLHVLKNSSDELQIRVLTGLEARSEQQLCVVKLSPENHFDQHVVAAGARQPGTTRGHNSNQGLLHHDQYRGPKGAGAADAPTGAAGVDHRRQEVINTESLSSHSYEEADAIPGGSLFFLAPFEGILLDSVYFSGSGTATETEDPAANFDRFQAELQREENEGEAVLWRKRGERLAELVDLDLRNLAQPEIFLREQRLAAAGSRCCLHKAPSTATPTPLSLFTRQQLVSTTQPPDFGAMLIREVLTIDLTAATTVVGKNTRKTSPPFRKNLDHDVDQHKNGSTFQRICVGRQPCFLQQSSSTSSSVLTSSVGIPRRDDAAAAVGGTIPRLQPARSVSTSSSSLLDDPASSAQQHLRTLAVSLHASTNRPPRTTLYHVRATNLDDSALGVVGPDVFYATLTPRELFSFFSAPPPDCSRTASAAASSTFSFGENTSQEFALHNGCSDKNMLPSKILFRHRVLADDEAFFQQFRQMATDLFATAIVDKDNSSASSSYSSTTPGAAAAPAVPAPASPEDQNPSRGSKNFRLVFPPPLPPRGWVDDVVQNHTEIQTNGNAAGVGAGGGSSETHRVVVNSNSARGSKRGSSNSKRSTVGLELQLNSSYPYPVKQYRTRTNGSHAQQISLFLMGEISTYRYKFEFHWKL